ncbi:uncharacterized protein LOC143543087 [Bidens hawaiensis]|uniref:uncharacterized protein LOC143543087 n=1 Tax=Bidens hawaiensis TaxID=980011 RepID=UPI0040493D68
MRTHNPSFFKHKKNKIMSCLNLLLPSLALLIISLLSSTPYFVYASLKEANALLNWKASLHIPNNSPLYSSWNDSAPCTSWFGVGCNDDWTVHTLNLTSSELNGTLDQFPFSFLHNLSRFELSVNHFFGPIPAQIHLLSKLVYLDFSGNKFSGAIPPEIGMLPNLETLHLFENQLNGSIPQEIGQLISLFELALYDNSLEGDIPSTLGNLRNLAYLYLDDNMLFGQIPHEFGHLVNLVEVYISNNSLSGPIPPTIGNLKQLTILFVFQNKLNGSIPQELGSLVSLQSLSLYSNHLTGPIPSTLGNLESLDLLHLYNNQLYGPIPVELGNLNSLTQLALSENQLNGSIPSSLKNLRNLQYLYLGVNNLSGPIPQGVLSSPVMLELEMDNNQLSGHLPEDLCHGRMLQHLSLSHNRLTGPIPIGVRNCHSLIRGRFDFNQFTGDISDSFGVYPSLDLLDVSHNNFSGQLSQHWSKCKNLTTLMMGYNNIIGCIPPEFGSLTRIQSLDLSSNHLACEIPSKLGNVKGMLKLFLQENNLSGVIPPELGSLHNLLALDLSRNVLNGTISRYIGECEHMYYLNLSNNKLSGKIPSEIGKLSQLTALDFSYNELVGPVPIFVNSPVQVFQGNPGLCGNVTGLKLCESQIMVKKHNNSFHHKLILVIILLLLGVVLLGLPWKFMRRKKSKPNVNAENFLNNNEFLALKRYSYSQIQNITNSFEIKLGQGGFGSVYKGSLSNGNLVAVKVLSESKGNGDDFINEVASVSRTSHVNIVNLVGFCLEGRQSALIYEFMTNGSLEKFIYGRGSSSISQLGWEKFHEIAIGIARGLEYLHRGCNTRILHFDIKPHNILLDQDFFPKISDFGLAKLFPEKKSMISMSRMRGTPGYIAPEIYSRNFGPVSHKSDVYSYGMMILEMVGGRKNVEVEVDNTSEIYFPYWIYKKVESEEQLGLDGIVSDEEHELARKMIIVGLWCIQTNSLNRPAITKVLEMLEGGSELLEIPPKPYMFSPQNSGYLSATDN